MFRSPQTCVYKPDYNVEAMAKLHEAGELVFQLQLTSLSISISVNTSSVELAVYMVSGGRASLNFDTSVLNCRERQSERFAARTEFAMFEDSVKLLSSRLCACTVHA